MPGGLELVPTLGRALGPLVHRARPTRVGPRALGGDRCGRRRAINADDKRLCRCCLTCPHHTLHTAHAFTIQLGYVTPTGCQRSSAREAWSRPHDTVQSSDHRGSWGTLVASRSEPPLSPGPHHDPGTLLMIQAMLMLIIRAVTRGNLAGKRFVREGRSVIERVRSWLRRPLEALEHDQRGPAALPRW
jgi:hypothetical protein